MPSATATCPPVANILSIAGSDPSGGAGIQADIKAISAGGGYAMAALTAVTAQNTREVQAVHLLAPDLVTAQIAAIRADIRIDAVKIGMLGNAAIIRAVSRALQGLRAPIVLDPVMIAKGGDRLLAADAVAALRQWLLPCATVITPNLPEAGDLLGLAPASTLAGMRQQARHLIDAGAQAVLLKGGHLPASDCTDLLCLADGAQHLFSAARITTANTHGTGCTLSSALATRLGQGQGLQEAARNAKAYVLEAIAAGDRLDVGGGHGPLDHFHGCALL